MKPHHKSQCSAQSRLRRSRTQCSTQAKRSTQQLLLRLPYSACMTPAAGYHQESWRQNRAGPHWYHMLISYADKGGSHHIHTQHRYMRQYESLYEAVQSQGSTMTWSHTHHTHLLE